MAKYLGETGLIYLWSKIKTWVSNYTKITSSTGKDTITAGNNSVDVYDWAQASTKPSYTVDELSDGTTYKRYSNTEKTKLSGIATGAEVNQNAFSNIKVGSTTIAADGKTDTLELVAGTSVTLTPDATNDKVTIGISTGAVPIATTTTPKMDGTAAVGSETKWAKGDHVHPSDTSKVSVSDTITESQINALFTTTTISFTIAGTTYQATSGMTWENWVSSNYNTGGFSLDGSSIYQSSSSKYVNYNSQEVQSTDTIVADASYTLNFSEDTE